MKYVKSFDGIRAISIFFVLLTHLGIFDLLPSNEFLINRIWPLFSGESGVMIFFALSGFLITSILFKELRESGRISLWRFYVRRALRLLPALLIFYIIIALLMRAHLIPASRRSFFFSFFYLYNFIPTSNYISELGHTWSLAVEEQFYLTWPFILSFFKAKKAFYIGCLLVVLCILAKIFMGRIQVVVDGQSGPLTNYFYIHRWFFPAVGPIIIGSLTSVIIGRRQEWARKTFENYKAMLSIAAVLYLAPLYLPGGLLEFGFVFQSAGISLLLAVLFFHQDISFSSVLGWGPLVYIGKISYGIYVFQGLFLRTGPGGPLWINQFPLDIIFTFVCAILSYHFVEKPILGLKRKFR